MPDHKLKKQTSFKDKIEKYGEKHVRSSVLWTDNVLGLMFNVIFFTFFFLKYRKTFFIIILYRLFRIFGPRVLMMMYELLFRYLSLSNVNGLMLYADVNMKYILFYVKGLLCVFLILYFFFFSFYYRRDYV